MGHELVISENQHRGGVGCPRVKSRLFHCSSPVCTTGERLLGSDLGQIKLSDKTTLGVEWAHDHHRLVFQRDDDADIVAP